MYKNMQGIKSIVFPALPRSEIGWGLDSQMPKSGEVYVIFVLVC
jgi:hypothetical protein